MAPAYKPSLFRMVSANSEARYWLGHPQRTEIMQKSEDLEVRGTDMGEKMVLQEMAGIESLHLPVRREHQM